eukprot:218200_1
MPSTVMPSTVMPSTVMPSTVMPSTVNPTTNNPSTVMPTTVMPTTVIPTTRQPTSRSISFGNPTSSPSFEGNGEVPVAETTDDIENTKELNELKNAGKTGFELESWMYLLVGFIAMICILSVVIFMYYIQRKKKKTKKIFDGIGRLQSISAASPSTSNVNNFNFDTNTSNGNNRKQTETETETDVVYATNNIANSMTQHNNMTNISPQNDM